MINFYEKIKFFICFQELSEIYGNILNGIVDLRKMEFNGKTRVQL